MINVCWFCKIDKFQRSVADIHQNKMDGDAGVERDMDDNGSTKILAGLNGDMGDMDKVSFSIPLQ